MDISDENIAEKQQTDDDDMDTSLTELASETTDCSQSLGKLVSTDSPELLVEEVTEKNIQSDNDEAPVDMNDIIELHPNEGILSEDDSESVEMSKEDNASKNVEHHQPMSISENTEDDQNTNTRSLIDTPNETNSDGGATENKDIEKPGDSPVEKPGDSPVILGTESGNTKNAADIGINTGSVTDSASEDENISYDITVNDDSITDNLMENGEENGIVINEKDIVTAADVYGRGKRIQTEKNSNENMSDEEDDEGKGLLFLRYRTLRSEQNYAKNPYVKSPNKRTLSSPGRKKASRKVLAKNFDEEKVLLPLKQGWRREVVIRNVFDKFTSVGGLKQTPADVYYHPPKGKKLRSMKEIVDYLKTTGSPFTEDNFSLLRRPISEPPYEVVRNAGKSKGRTSFSKEEDASFDTPLVKPEVVIERADDEGEEEEEIEEVEKNKKIIKSTPVSTISKHAKMKITPMRPTFKYQGRGRPPKNKKLPHLTKTKNLLYRHSSKQQHGHGYTETLIKDVTVTMPDFSNQDGDTEDSSTSDMPPVKRFKATARKSTTPRCYKYFKLPSQNSSQKTGPETLCTLSCPGQENIPPSLQCVVCLCLFHPHCVAFTPSDNQEFTCLRCYDPSQLQPRTKAITVMRVAPATPVPISPRTSAPVIKQEPVDPDHPTPKDVNPTLLEHLRTSILERQVPSTIAGHNASILSPVRAAIVGPRQDVSCSVVSPSNQNLPKLSLLTDPVRRADVQGKVYMSLSGVVSHNTPQSHPNTLLVPGTSLLTNAQVAGSTLHLPRLVAPVPHMQYVSPTPTTPSLRTPVLSMMPPRLIAAPKTPPVIIVDSNKTPPIASNLMNETPSPELNGKTGQILTLPSAVAKRLNLQQPLALKINNVQITVPPSSFLFTTDGLKLFLPPKTFPLQLGETAKLSVTVTNDKSNASQPEVSVNINTDQSDSSALGCIKPLTGDTVQTTVHSKANTGHCSTRWRTGINPGMCYVKKLYGGFDCMFCIFQYLNMKDLLRVAMVCRTWRQLAMHPSHWRNLRLQSLKILNWERAIDFMLLRAVQSLNLHGLLHNGDTNRTWHQMIPQIHKLSCLRKISFGLVPASVLHMFSEKMPYLEVFNAETITDMTNEEMWSVSTKLDLGKFSALTQLRELRLRGVAGLLLPSFSFSGGMAQLGTMKNLTTLSLTSLKDVGDQEFGFLAELTNLEVLELGHCSTWSSEAYFHLGQLKQLKCLRLESGGEIPDIGLGDCLLNMKELEKLELMMFVIAESVHLSLSQLPKLSHLAIWPSTSSQPAALVNSHVLAVVSRLAKLKKLEWGIVKDQDKSVAAESDDTADLHNKAQAEWIPFLSAGLPAEGVDISDSSSVQFMSVHQFTEKLAIIHPTTDINVFSTHLLHPKQFQANVVS
ncbi:uncharacterized protein LOC117322915 [Pecten maximus]|uniref:uncharacterized protein LOC117322915 n=1 Tax=Pecten maximus TaxID=6579 RepID=UPI001458B302|nr:uncharacterized protein LOC117322915 [Pecten maximus]